MGKDKAPMPEENAGTKKLLGTFTAPPPLCIGEPYKDKRFRDDRMNGKQFTSGQLKHENSKISPGTFEPPKLLWAEQKDKYQDGIKYKDLFPADKKVSGFLSSDFPRRDEFSNTIRTQQLREVLKKEAGVSKEAALAREKRDKAFATANQVLENKKKGGTLDGYLPKQPLFDVVFRIPEASLKLARDDRQAGLWYKTQRQQVMAGVDTTTTKIQTHLTEPSWVSISVGGKALNVLVDSAGHILHRKELKEAVSKQPGIDI